MQTILYKNLMQTILYKNLMQKILIKLIIEVNYQAISTLKALMMNLSHLLTVKYQQLMATILTTKIRLQIFEKI